MLLHLSSSPKSCVLAYITFAKHQTAATHYNIKGSSKQHKSPPLPCPRNTSLRSTNYREKVNGDQLRRDVTDLLPGSLYCFRVAAVNRMGQGPWSENTDMVRVDAWMGRCLLDTSIVAFLAKTERFVPRHFFVSFRRFGHDFCIGADERMPFPKQTFLRTFVINLSFTL